MAITVKHPFVSTVPDATDTSIVRPSNWNADHTVTGLGTAAELNAGVANGVATLDGSGTVPISQLPAAVLGALSYQGTWNASTNTPTLTSSVGTKGYYYVVNVAGNTNLNGITDWLVGDWAVYNGSAWQKIDNTDAVTSVNGLTGTVVLTTTNVAEGTNLYYTDARARGAVSAGTGISYNSTTGVITNSSPSLGGDVVGPASSTDNAVARYDTTTGKLLQNSVVTIDDSGAGTGFTTLAASTSLTTPAVQATNSGGLSLKNSAGTTQISMGGGGGDNVSVNVSTNLNGSNAQIDISPTGTGHVHMKPTGTGAVEIAPTNAGTINNMAIGGTTPLAGSFTNLSVTGTTSFDGSQGTAGQVLTSAGTGATPTWTTPTTGTVTSVTGTSPVVSSGGTTPAISMPAATSSVNGYLTSADWTTFNSKQPAGTYVTSVAATSPVTSSGGTTPTIAMPAATTSVSGYLTSTDWNTFNNKGSGTVTSVSGTAGRITSTGGTTPVIDLASGVATAGTTGSSALVPVITIDTYGRVTSITTAANPQGTVTSVTGTSPVASSGGATPAISLSSGYGDTLNPYASKTANYVLAAPNGSAGVPTFRAIVAADIPTLNQNTTGTASNVTGTVAIGNGGTGQTTAVAAFNALNPMTTTGDIIYESSPTTAARLGIGSTGQVLTVAGGLPSWANAVSSNITALGMYENSATISANYTIGTGNNAMSAGPITVNTGITVTVPTGSTWTIV
jgi:hypothetical protein